MTTPGCWVAGLITTAALAAVVATAGTSAQGVPAQPRTRSGSDVNELFAKIYPVFTHARCINCHGVVQSLPGNIRSVTGDTHPGEAQGDAQVAADCSVCHEEPDVERHWQFTAPESMWWVGKDIDQLCALQSAQVTNFNTAAGGSSASTPGSYLHHLTSDPLITQAFRGRAGGAFAQDRRSDPPPMTRTEFLASAKAWVDAGAPCKATGSVSQTERFKTTYRYPYPVGNGTTTVTEVARRDVQVFRLPDGSAVADSKISGNQTIITKYVHDGCSVTITSRNEWHSTTPSSVPAEITMNLKDGQYEIAFTLRPDTTKQTSEGHTESTCGLPPMNSSDVDEELTWEPWVFAIRCPPDFTPDADNTISCDPRQPQKEPKVSGEMTRTIVGTGMDAAEPQSWLNVSPTGTSRADNGAPLPITVKTIWNLKTK